MSIAQRWPLELVKLYEEAEARKVWLGQEVNLLGWLQEREQQSGGAPVGSPKPAALAPDMDSSAPKHQQAAEVRPLFPSLPLQIFVLCPTTQHLMPVLQ